MSDNQDSIGALWQKQSNKGIWFSGSIEIKGVKIPIVVFKNDFKKEDKHPDYRIFVKREAAERTESAKPESAPENKPEPDDLPF